MKIISDAHFPNYVVEMGDGSYRFLYSWEAVAVKGKLPESSQNGDGLHLTGEAFGLVMQYIRTHAWR